MLFVDDDDSNVAGGQNIRRDGKRCNFLDGYVASLLIQSRSVAPTGADMMAEKRINEWCKDRGIMYEQCEKLQRRMS